MDLPTDPWKIVEAVGTWVAGLATVAAVVVSLRLARAQGRPRLMVSATIMDIVPGDGTPPPWEKKLLISATNTGTTVARVNGVSWYVVYPRWVRWLFGRPAGALYQNPPEGWRLPVELTPSKEMQWLLPNFEEIAEGIAKHLLAEWPTKLRLRYLRVITHTTVGVNGEGRLSSSFLERVRAKMTLKDV